MTHVNSNFVFRFRDDCFQSEMLPEVTDLGFDYAEIPDTEGVLQIEIEEDLVSIYLKPLRDTPDLAGLGTRFQQLCTDCELEFLSPSAI